MTLNLDFTPIEQARIIAAARQKGLDPADFVKRIVTEHLPEIAENERSNGDAPLQNIVAPSHFYFTATREEFNEALDEIAWLNANLPVLSDAAFDRENLYEDRF